MSAQQSNPNQDVLNSAISAVNGDNSVTKADNSDVMNSGSVQGSSLSDSKLGGDAISLQENDTLDMNNVATDLEKQVVSSKNGQSNTVSANESKLDTSAQVQTVDSQLASDDLVTDQAVDANAVSTTASGMTEAVVSGGQSSQSQDSQSSQSQVPAVQNQQLNTSSSSLNSDSSLTTPTSTSPLNSTPPASTAPLTSENNLTEQQDQVTEQNNPSSTVASDAPLPDELQNLPGLLKILFKQDTINAEQAQDLNNKYLSTGKAIEQLLKEDKKISEFDLVKAKAEYNDIPFINVNQTGLAPEAINKVDESVAKRYQILPFALDQARGVMQVAMANPLDVQAVSFVEQKTGLKLEVHYAVASELQRIISQRYAQDLSSDVTEALEDSSLLKKQKDLDVTQRGGMVRAAPINKIVNTILDFALEARASDVHIEPQVQKTRVRYRIDGILQEKLVLPSSVHGAVVSRIKILSNLKIDEKRVPQDGRFDYKGKTEEVDLRVSTCPSIHGEKVVMRLLKKNAAVPGLNDLGLRGLALTVVQKSIKIPYGIVLVTGPTGSGKTTSLYSILNIINTPKVNIMTLEDPVEYQMKGVTQVQTNPQAGLTFANGLRSFLRQDPDIIMVGEIRDGETAELAVQASLTGHLVFSTLHTNSAAGALPRLMDMGVEPFLLSSSIIMTMGQRVVRLINKEYKEEYKPDQAVIEDFKQVLGPLFDKWCQDHNKQPNEITLFRAKEDRPQTEPEYKGRVGIFEVMDIQDDIKSLINQSSNADTLEDAALKNGMIRMKQDGYLKVLDGLTTVEEVLRVAEVK